MVFFAASAPRTQSGKAARSKGTKNFSNDELTLLLELIEKVLPIGNEFWELNVDFHKEKFLEINRNATQSRKNFTDLKMKNLSQETPPFPELH